MFTLYEIIKEFRHIVSRRCVAHPAVALGCGASIFAIVCLSLMHFVIGPQRDPFSYRRIQGRLTYEDGNVLPVGDVMLTFVPLEASTDGRPNPRTGQATLIPETGRFDFASTKRRGDGIVVGLHKILVTGPNRLPLAADVLPLEYASFETTPLEVDARNGRLDLTVKRPASPAPVGKATAGR